MHICAAEQVLLLTYLNIFFMGQIERGWRSYCSKHMSQRLSTLLKISNSAWVSILCNKSISQMQKDIEKQRKPILRKTSKYLRIPHFELKTEKSNMIKTNMMEKKYFLCNDYNFRFQNVSCIPTWPGFSRHNGKNGPGLNLWEKPQPLEKNRTHQMIMVLRRYRMGGTQSLFFYKLELIWN